MRKNGPGSLAAAGSDAAPVHGPPPKFPVSLQHAATPSDTIATTATWKRNPIETERTVAPGDGPCVRCGATSLGRLFPWRTSSKRSSMRASFSWRFVAIDAEIRRELHPHTCGYLAVEHAARPGQGGEGPLAPALLG